MRQETNNEMDLLLRRLGRRDDATVSNVVGDHLDADELSAFAENAVPAAARTRYTAHLAECGRCRELVVQLSGSAGAVSAVEAATVSKPSVWRTFLASLFTPAVLRYAAPALGLIVVAVIGFVVLRRDQPVPYVTQVTNNEPRPAAPPAAETTSPALDRSTDSPAKTTPSAEALADRQKGTLHPESAPAPPPNAAPVVSSVETGLSKDAAAAPPKPDQQPASANEPAPKPSATPEESPRTDREAKKKEAQEVSVDAAPASQKELRAAQSEGRKTNNDLSRAGNPTAGTTDKVGPQGAGSVAKSRSETFAFSAETRSVAGRRFRKQGGVWTDTAYDSSRETTSLRRGSEQYRGLIADEPEIKRIADELEGEIIVVWKGRAYRIR